MAAWLALTLTLLPGGVTLATDVSAALVSERAPMAQLQPLDFDASVFDILVDDVDGDGFNDLALTSHSANYTQIFYQTAPREFVASPKIDAVGFHPGDLIRLPVDDDRLFLMNAEGENALKVFRSTPEREFGVLSFLGAPAPRVATLPDWPLAGLSLAFAPFGQNQIFLVEGFQPALGSRGVAYSLPLESKLSRIDHLDHADLDNDGSEEVLFVDRFLGRLYAVPESHEEGTLPELKQLWQAADKVRVSLAVSRDVNGDAAADVLVPESAVPSSRTDGPRVFVLINDGAGNFEPMVLPYPLEPGQNGRQYGGIQSIDVACDESGRRLVLVTSTREVLLLSIPENWSGGAIPHQRLAFGHNTAIRRALLKDIDGDGILDIVLGAPSKRGQAHIIYGPLWDGFAKASAAGLTIDQLPYPPQSDE
jgi:hypothetical protein